MISNGEETKREGIEAEKDNKKRNPIWNLISEYCQPYIHYFGFSIFAMLFARSLWLFPPVVLGVSFDAIFLEDQPYQLPFIPVTWIPEQQIDQLWFSLGLFIISFIGGSVLYIIGSLSRDIAAYRVQHDLRVDAYATVQALDAGFFDSQKTGEIMSILNNDVNHIEQFLTSTFGKINDTLFTILMVGIYMVTLHWQLAIVGFITPIFIGLFNYWYSSYVEPKHQNRRQQVGNINTRIENNLGGMHLVKIYNQESYENKRIIKESEKYQAISWAVARARVFFGQATNLLMNIGYIILFLLGGYWVLYGPPLFFSGSLGAGTVLTFLIYNNRFSYPFKQMTVIIDSYQETKAAGGRVFGLFEKSRTVYRDSETMNLQKMDGQVEYNNVEFSYKNSDEISISHISFRVNSGEMIGIVGPTGAGKSTLMKLLLRFYDVDNGEISVDGRNIQDISLKSLRGGMSYVGQEPYLFDGTIRENIAYSRPDSSDTIIKEAAQRAGAHEFIDKFPNGYETKVGERGVKLSGGQRQRISIARAVLDDPDILILDEATSHVDNKTEAHIQNSLEELICDRTTFVVAHRLSTVRQADRIIVLDQGEVVGKGTHEELLEQGGLYANLWNIQVGNVDSLPDEFIQQVSQTK